MNRLVTTIGMLVVVLIGTHAFAWAAPVSTAFTYQGRLNLSGQPVDDSADFKVFLVDAPQGGNLVAGPLEVLDVAVVDGLFTLELDFGAAAFNGDQRWLVVQVRSPAGQGAFVALSPRQRLTATPYATTAAKTIGVDGHSLDTPGGAVEDVVFVDGAGGVVIGAEVTFGDPDPDQRCDCAVATVSADARYQSFTAGQSGRLTSITVWVRNPVQSPAELTLTVHNGADPSGRRLGSNAKLIPGFHNAPVTFDLTSIAVGKDQLYAWGLSSPGNVLTFYQDDDPYPLGRADLSPVHDLYFATEVAAVLESGDAVMHLNTDGKVGIGTRAPSNTLSVDGSADFAGKVGIGTDSPTSTLSVDGSADLVGPVRIGPAGPDAYIDIAGRARIGFDDYRDFGAISLANNQGKQILYAGAGYYLQTQGVIGVVDFYQNHLGGGFQAAATGTEMWADIKNFRSPNPLDPSTDIVYACVEGPEAAAYVRGTAELIAGRATITLPEHFQLVSVEAGMTVQLTPLSADSQGLAVTRKSLDGIEVAELQNGRGYYAFDWEVKAVRKGHENYQVLRPWEQTLPANADVDAAWRSRLDRLSRQQSIVEHAPMDTQQGSRP